ncbi:MAG TPA: hypothetical protein VFS71_17655 [Flavobacterium sp.]|uniref:hypothetical protein n=1 Tax=Flavobacterium sp. TaxID=239 RepID=UPI002DB5A486|nr:hypothetical protein [Flavobacterium sp.]HEU4791518.1 hypothetical protein [Flavobacterium sp.]
MKKVNDLKKKKVINDLLDKKFEHLDKIVGGNAIACSVDTSTPKLPGGCSASTGGCKGTC